MFGGNVSPANSPHLRKSTSRSRVFDLGIISLHHKAHNICHPMLETLVIIMYDFHNSKYLQVLVTWAVVQKKISCNQ